MSILSTSLYLRLEQLWHSILIGELGVIMDIAELVQYLAQFLFNINMIVVLALADDPELGDY